jgi:hypothetical protein
MYLQYPSIHSIHPFIVSINPQYPSIYTVSINPEYPSVYSSHQSIVSSYLIPLYPFLNIDISSILSIYVHYFNFSPSLPIPIRHISIFNLADTLFHEKFINLLHSSLREKCCENKFYKLWFTIFSKVAILQKFHLLFVFAKRKGRCNITLTNLRRW